MKEFIIDTFDPKVLMFRPGDLQGEVFKVCKRGDVELKHRGINVLRVNW